MGVKKVIRSGLPKSQKKKGPPKKSTPEHKIKYKLPPGSSHSENLSRRLVLELRGAPRRCCVAIVLNKRLRTTCSFPRTLSYRGIFGSLMHRFSLGVLAHGSRLR